MSLADKPKLYYEMYKFIKYLYTLIHNFPKEYKYSLGEEVIGSAWQCLDNIVFANKLPNSRKSQYILKASADFEKVVLRLRMANELKLFNDKKMAYIITCEVAIEKMLSGWYKWAKAKIS